MADRVWGRIRIERSTAVVVPSGRSVVEILARLEAGEPPAHVARQLGLDPTEVLAALVFAGLGPGDDDGPALTQRPPQRPKLAAGLTDAALVELLPRSTRAARLCLASGILQILDFWDASHDAAQRADDLGERAFAAYWHGIAHRREPDSGNAAYWFRRVGRHPIFGPLRAAARPWLDAHAGTSLAHRLSHGETWDPFAMIDLCAAARPGSALETLARRIQRVEMILLLDATASALEERRQETDDSR
jgi:hypothetical protein